MLNPIAGNTYIFPSPTAPGSKPSPASCCGEANMGNTGITEFIELSDVPYSYAGQAGKIVAVNQAESGLEFINQTASGWRPAIRVARDDGRWTDDHTYTDHSLAGATFFVYYNGVKILTPEIEGFAISGTGGFTYDPAKFQFYADEFLYLIF